MKPAGTWRENVNQVIGPAPILNRRDNSYINNQGNNQNNAGPSQQQQNQYREHHQSYVVFCSTLAS